MLSAKGAQFNASPGQRPRLTVNAAPLALKQLLESVSVGNR